MSSCFSASVWYQYEIAMAKAVKLLMAVGRLGRGPGAVVITLGSEGALVAEGNTAKSVRSIEVEPVDTVGAGDAFCGSLAAMLAEGKSVAEAAKVGCVAGALATTKPGAIPSLPTRQQVGDRLRGDGA